EATAHLRVTVKAADPKLVGRAFSNATMELALASYSGFHTTTPPTSESAYGVYWPTLLPAELIDHQVVLPDGTRRSIPPTPTGRLPESTPRRRPLPPAPEGETRRAPLGRVCAARSGDKGGNANVGLWTRSDLEYAWLREHLTVDNLRELLAEAADLEIRRYELANLHALNFVIVGLLGAGVAASTRPDPQAKGLGEYLRSRHVDIPVDLLAEERRDA
ncbi:MAG TPA: exopolyphosphatase, partial [Nocardioidaceae bacterium]|nr:exopolyphosphatase [Nocardioidaceae bacterium]